MDREIKAFIFDLDGVIADTAKYHFLAWKKIADRLGFELREEDNERLKGISRMESLKVVLEIGGKCGITEEEKRELASEKNHHYLKMIEGISPTDILPGTLEFIEKLKKKGYKIALGSASKSGRIILEKLKIEALFDAIVDGNVVEKAKPNPEVFKRAAELMGVPDSCCVVVEDAISGIKAAHAGGMKCIGIGDEKLLKEADIHVKSTEELLKIASS